MKRLRCLLAGHAWEDAVVRWSWGNELRHMDHCRRCGSYRP